MSAEMDTGSALGSWITCPLPDYRYSEEGMTLTLGFVIETRNLHDVALLSDGLVLRPDGSTFSTRAMKNLRINDSVAFAITGRGRGLPPFLRTLLREAPWDDVPEDIWPLNYFDAHWHGIPNLGVDEFADRTAQTLRSAQDADLFKIAVAGKTAADIPLLLAFPACNDFRPSPRGHIRGFGKFRPSKQYETEDKLHDAIFDPAKPGDLKSVCERALLMASKHYKDINSNGTMRRLIDGFQAKVTWAEE